MAKKGQKFRKYTTDERNTITMEYINNKGTYVSLSKKYNVSWKTIESWVRKYKKQGDLIPRKKGRVKTSHLSEIEKLRLENEILKKFQTFLKQPLEKK